MCYQVEFGCSALKDVGINTGSKLGSAGTHSVGMRGMTDPKIHAQPSRVTTSILVVAQSINQSINRFIEKW